MHVYDMVTSLRNDFVFNTLDNPYRGLIHFGNQRMKEGQADRHGTLYESIDTGY